MLAFRVEVDGEPFVTAGAEDWSMLAFSLMASRQLLGRDKTNHLHLHIGGMAGDGSIEDGEHLRWSSPAPAVGKSMTVTIVETDEVDPPAMRHASDPASILRANFRQRQDRYDYYLALKAEFEPQGG